MHRDCQGRTVVAGQLRNMLLLTLSPKNESTTTMRLLCVLLNLPTDCVLHTIYYTSAQEKNSDVLYILHTYYNIIMSCDTILKNSCNASSKSFAEPQD